MIRHKGQEKEHDEVNGGKGEDMAQEKRGKRLFMAQGHGGNTLSGPRGCRGRHLSWHRGQASAIARASPLCVFPF